MKIKDLYEKLEKAIECGNAESEVYIETEKGMHEFSIVSFDDLGSANLCIGKGDRLA